MSHSSSHPSSEIKIIADFIGLAGSSNPAEREVAFTKLRNKIEDGSATGTDLKRALLKINSGVVEIEEDLQQSNQKVGRLQKELEECRSDLALSQREAIEANLAVQTGQEQYNLNKKKNRWKICAALATVVLIVSNVWWSVGSNHDQIKLASLAQNNQEQANSINISQEQIDSLQKRLEQQVALQQTSELRSENEKVRIREDADQKIKLAESRAILAEKKINALQQSMDTSRTDTTRTDTYSSRGQSDLVSAGLASNESVSRNFQIPATPKTRSNIYSGKPGGWMNFRWGMSTDQVKSVFTSPNWKNTPDAVESIQACSAFPGTRSLLSTQGRGFGRSSGSDHPMEINFCFTEQKLLMGVAMTLQNTPDTSAIIENEHGAPSDYRTTIAGSSKIDMWIWNSGFTQIEMIKGINPKTTVVAVGSIKSPDQAWSSENR